MNYFEKYHFNTEEITDGYGEWLKNNNDDNKIAKNKDEMNRMINNKKKQIKKYNCKRRFNRYRKRYKY